VVTPATRQLLKETLIDELQALPEILRKAENEYYHLHHVIAIKRYLLESGETKFTKSLQVEIQQAEAEADRQKAEVDFLRRRLASYQSIASLLSAP